MNRSLSWSIKCENAEPPQLMDQDSRAFIRTLSVSLNGHDQNLDFIESPHSPSLRSAFLSFSSFAHSPFSDSLGCDGSPPKRLDRLSPFSDYSRRALKRSKLAITFHRCLHFESPTSPTYTASWASKYERWIERKRLKILLRHIIEARDPAETARESLSNSMERPIFVIQDSSTQNWQNEMLK